MQVREARPDDADRLFELMQGLAKFEDYFDAFSVSKDSIRRYGFGDGALFKAFVAEAGERVCGMAITYVVPWTYTLRPKLVLKELFIEDDARSRGAGKKLFAAIANYAESIGAGEVVWTVMAGNTLAEQFYQSVGGTPDPKWQNWTLSLEGRPIVTHKLLSDGGHP